MFTQSTHPQYLMLMRDLIAEFQCRSGQSTLVIEQNGWWVTIQTAYVHTFHRPTHWIFWIPLIFGCVCHSYTSSYQQNSQLSQLTYSDSWHQTTSWFMVMCCRTPVWLKTAYVIQFLGMFFWCISSMDERLRIGGLCLFCGWLANHAWWTPHNCEEVKWVHVWLGKEGKRPKRPNVYPSFR